MFGWIKAIIDAFFGNSQPGEESLDFDVPDFGIIWRDPSKLIGRFDIRRAVNERYGGHSGIKKSKKLMAQSNISQWNDLQRPIQQNIRNSIQQNHNANLVLNALRKTLMNTLSDFVNKQKRLVKKGKGAQMSEVTERRYMKFMAKYNSELLAERRHINTLKAAAEGKNTWGLKIRKHLTITEGLFGKTWRMITDRNHLGKAFTMEKLIRKKTKKGILKERQFINTLKWLEKFHDESHELVKDLAVLNLTLLESLLDYERRIKIAVSDDVAKYGKKALLLPPEAIKVANAFASLRKKALVVFENERTMITQVGNLGAETKDELAELAA
ncbi:hypothetical protein ACFLZ7_01840 [Nanoarchaeota archaeon]